MNRTSLTFLPEAAVLPLTVCGAGIRQDAAGRFSLNDLHRAAGGEDRHRPSRWAENDQTKALAEEASKAGIPALASVKGGTSPGTYVAKELVYAYAMWISPAFHLQVIRAYDQMVTAPAAPALDLRQPGQMLAVATQLAEIVQEQQAQLTAQAPKVAFAEAVGNATNTQTISQVAKALGVGPRKLFAFMRENGILMKNDLPFQTHIDLGRFKVVEVPYKNGDGEDRMKLQTRVTGKGVTFLQQRLAKAAEVSHG